MEGVFVHKYGEIMGKLRLETSHGEDLTVVPLGSFRNRKTPALLDNRHNNGSTEANFRHYGNSASRMSQSSTVPATVDVNDIEQVVREVVRQEMQGFLEKLSSEFVALPLNSNHEGAAEHGEGRQKLLRR